MSLSKESLAIIKQLDDETTAISDRIDTLLASPNTTEQEFRDALKPLADRLDSLGHDPTNPVPA